MHMYLSIYTTKECRRVGAWGGEGYFSVLLLKLFYVVYVLYKEKHFACFMNANLKIWKNKNVLADVFLFKLMLALLALNQQHD